VAGAEAPIAGLEPTRCGGWVGRADRLRGFEDLLGGPQVIAVTADASEKGTAVSPNVAHIRDLRQAKALYFVYEGSEFYMSRNGVDGEFRDYAVPDEVRNDWEADLLAMNLVRLRTMGVCSGTVDFLVTRERPEYLPEVLAAMILPDDLNGTCQLLESMVTYIDLCDGHYERGEIVRALEYVTAEAHTLLRRARAEEKRQRIRRIAEDCAARRSARV
jgi:hypothetical protein